MKVQLATAAAVKVADAKITADLLSQAIKYQRKMVVSMTGDDNPLAVQARTVARTRQELLEAVLESLQGRHIDLKMYVS